MKIVKFLKQKLLLFIREFFINTIAASPFICVSLRRFIMRYYGIDIGNSIVFPKCFFGGNNIKIGDKCFINYNCFFDNSGRIEVGDNTHLGPNVFLCTSTHEIGDKSKRAGKNYAKDIKIGKGCWIGARAIIIPGVTIADGSVVGAGAVVSKDVPPNSLVVGCPARVIQTFDD